MGQTLSEPVVQKASGFGENKKFVYGLSEMQGWRITMEDAHVAIVDAVPDYINDESTGKSAKSEAERDEATLGFFAVYDGHGGQSVARYSGNNLHHILLKEDNLEKKEYAKALQQAFLNTDQAILKDPEYEDDPSGCTATVAIVTGDNRIFCANAGDSRTVLGSKGVAINLSEDHKPGNPEEKARIVAGGGFVELGRVNGNLALSRAIGDFDFKKGADLPAEQQIVTVFPDIEEHKITDDDEFLILACDGIWDCVTSQEAVAFVRRGIAAKQDLHKICENLMDNCLSTTADGGGIGCDNMTVVIVALLNGKSKDEWYNFVSERVEKGDGPVSPPQFAEFKGPGYSHFKGGKNEGTGPLSLARLTSNLSNDDDDSDRPADEGMMRFPSMGRIFVMRDGTELFSEGGRSDGILFAQNEDNDDADETESGKIVEANDDDKDDTNANVQDESDESEYEDGPDDGDVEPKPAQQASEK